MSISILNGNQAREYNRAAALQNFFEQQSKVYMLLPLFQTEVNLFFDNNKQLQTYIPVKKEKGTGITKDKEELKSDTAIAAGFVCAIATAYAIKINDNDLKANVDYTGSAILNMKDGDVLGFVNALVIIVTPLLSKEAFAGYPVTPDTLAELVETATAFNSSIGKAGIVDTNSSIASRNIDEVLLAIRANVIQFDLLINFFKKKYPDFAEAYHKASLIIDTGVHHSGIKGIIINSATGQPVKSASVTLQGKTKTKTVTADSDAKYQVIRFLPGKCSLTITAPGYESRTVEVTIIRGKIIDLNISLQSQVIEFNKTA